MMKDMLRLKHGKTSLLALGLLALSGCRNSVPPKIEICIGDGVGGADCIEANGAKLYRPPSQLLDYWMTSEPDEANYSSWCYDTTTAAAQAGMKQMKAKAIE